ncbi:MAG: translation initiation factor IF-2 [Candidatus Spechtbacterales bacterium]
MDTMNKKIKPPVVVILGHVDHGKTSILDYIRKAKVAEAESGGITQHTGAYQVEQNGKMITFIDTPGHEAFSAMRSRGADVADIAILVTAADDGVMPQTKEAISIIQKSNIPFIVAINKIDKPEADVQKVKNQLTENSILLEGYGGQVPNVEISANTGEGMDGLLDMINLVAELEELEVQDGKEMEAVAIESSMDQKRGSTATLLVKKGVLKTGDIIAGNSTWAKVKQLESFRGETLKEAGPSTPVVVLGFSSVPGVGEKFINVSDQKEAEARVQTKQRKEQHAHIVENNEEQKIVNLILKSDAEGTLEAVHDVLDSISNEELIVRILHEGVGEINDSDVRLAGSGKAIVVGFRVKPNNIAINLAEQQDVTVIHFQTIYELVEGARAAIVEHVDPSINEEVIGRLKVLKIFRSESARMIVGGKIIEGEMRRGASVKVLREEENIGKGKVKQLKKVDKPVEKAEKGEEIGLLFEGSAKLEEGDIIEAFEVVKSKLKL